jgi:hypothetical protein
MNRQPQLAGLRLLARILAGLLVAQSAAGQGVLYVDDDAPPAGDGLTWSTAFRFLQDALATAAASAGVVTEIRVAQGIYLPDREEASPDGTGSQEATFQLINGVALTGGFAGLGAPSPDQRDIDVHESILSGDVNGDDIPDFPYNIWENSHHVVTGSGTNGTAILDGFSITAGHANYYSNWVGGGMYNDAGSPTVVDCTFRGNIAHTAGVGMYNWNSDPAISNCVFIENWFMSGEDTGDGGWGSCNTAAPGGVIYNGYSSPTVIDCTFIGSWGAGRMHNWKSNPVVRGCVFSNTSGAMTNDNSDPIVVDCTFRGNSGGGTPWCPAGVIANVNDSRPTVANCLFSGNSGAAIGNSDSSPTVMNCSFIGNGVGLLSSFFSNATVVNCVLWESGPDPVSDHYDAASSVYHSNLQGGWFGDGTNNIDADPMIVRAPDPGPDGWWGSIDDDYGDLHLLAGSPCVDAGDNGAAFCILADLDGRDRFADDPDTPDCQQAPGQCGHSPVVDMGAYELASPPAAIDFGRDCNHDMLADACEIADGFTPDCNGNGVPDGCALADGTSFDCNGNGVPDECDLDCNGNGFPDDCDIADGTSYDCNGNGVPDECDLAGGTSFDCNANGVLDECDLAGGTSPDCNANGVPDECDLAEGTSLDCNINGVPDGCDLAEGIDADCNANGVLDSCDLTGETSWDVNDNDVPDECECVGDLIVDGVIDVFDFLTLLTFWGPCGPGCEGDLDHDGNVGVTDFLVLLGYWGPCS